jgi:hypothetical protein
MAARELFSDAGQQERGAMTETTTDARQPSPLETNINIVFLA